MDTKRTYVQVTLYTHGNTVQYKVGEHYLGQGGGVEYVPVSGYEGGLLVAEGYAAPAQPWPAHNLLPIDDTFDPGNYYYLLCNSFFLVNYAEESHDGN